MRFVESELISDGMAALNTAPGWPDCSCSSCYTTNSGMSGGGEMYVFTTEVQAGAAAGCAATKGVTWGAGGPASMQWVIASATQ